MKRTIAISLCAVLAIPIGWAAVAPDVARDMMDGARQFLAGLDADNRQQASFSFDDDERLNWHFIPRTREGLPYAELTPAQRRLADRLLGSALSRDGLNKAQGVMYLDQILFEAEGRDIRNSDGYYFSVFGEPSEQGAWGWRLEGHHLALNFTIVDGEIVASSPAFMGSNPAVVREGPLTGLEVLADEESVGRELLALFEGEQRDQVIIADRATGMVSGNSFPAEPAETAGLAMSEMSGAQREALMALLRVYIDRMRPELARQEIQKITDAGLDEIRFAWAGGVEPPHYYRIQGPTFLVEYDNTQGNGNHIHSVWRDFESDFATDALAEHYAADHPNAATPRLAGLTPQ